MLPIDMQALPAWLSQQRWFGGKGAQVAGVRDLDRAQISPGLLLSAVEVSYAPPRPPESYALALRPWTGKGGIVEGLDDDAARALLGVVRGRLRIATAAGALQGERFDGPGSPLERLSPAPAVRRLGAEQSNTSVVFDEGVILKLIRKLERGVNPELEIGAFLARNGFAGTPPLLGAISVTGAVDATVAVANEFVPVEADGWSYVLESLRRGEPPLLQVRELGERIGELHAALASDSRDPAFAPEPIRREDLTRWTEALLRELDLTVEAARSAMPVRPSAERRAKHSPLKDVAGMLRSFAYAAAAAGRRELAGQLRDSFLQGWRRRAAHLLPGDDQAARILLDSLELEKLLYELRYELGHRPDWVAIPAADLREAT